jgi:large-conductance mechanosensitive channel
MHNIGMILSYFVIICITLNFIIMGTIILVSNIKKYKKWRDKNVKQN